MAYRPDLRQSCPEPIEKVTDVVPTGRASVLLLEIPGFDVAVRGRGGDVLFLREAVVRGVRDGGFVGRAGAGVWIGFFRHLLRWRGFGEIQVFGEEGDACRWLHRGWFIGFPGAAGV